MFLFCVHVEQGRDSAVAVDGHFLDVGVIDGPLVKVLVCTKSAKLRGNRIMVYSSKFIRLHGMVWLRFVWSIRCEMRRRKRCISIFKGG